MKQDLARVTYCWTRPSGYLRACIAALQDRESLAASMMFWEPAAEAPYVEESVRLSNTRLLRPQEATDSRTIREYVAATKPDVVVFAGWAHKPYVKLLTAPSLQSARFVMTADTAILHTWRQLIGGLWLRGLLNRVDGVCVPGERGFQLLRSWGVPASKIFRLLYAVDFQAFSAAAEQRPTERVRRFVFAGRYISAKGIETMIEAYASYRQNVSAPWELHTAGTGPLAHLITGPGVVDHGFLQPPDLVAFFGEGGVFVLPSLYEPWGQVIVEAAAAKMPVICSTECGAGPEIVRDFHSGRIVPAGDPGALAEAMIWMHEHADRIPKMGHSANAVARAYSAERWAENQEFMIRRLLARQ